MKILEAAPRAPERVRYRSARALVRGRYRSARPRAAERTGAQCRTPINAVVVSVTRNARAFIQRQRAGHEDPEAVGVERLAGFNREVVVVHVARDKRGFGDRHIAVRAVAEQTDPVGSSGLGESRAGTKKKDQARETEKCFGKRVKGLHW